MTTDEFFAALRRVRDQFEWELLPDMGPGSERRGEPRLHLRAVSPGHVRTAFDPIGAVCYARTGKRYGPGHSKDAAEILGIQPPDTSLLLAASNDSTWAGPGGRREPVPELQALRARLIRAVGLDVRPGVS